MSAEPLSRRFGLTPEQFSENLRDTYQRHEVEQFPTDPEDMAQDYITGYWAAAGVAASSASVMLACCGFLPHLEILSYLSVWILPVFMTSG